MLSPFADDLLLDRALTPTMTLKLDAFGPLKARQLDCPCGLDASGYGHDGRNIYDDFRIPFIPISIALIHVRGHCLYKTEDIDFEFVYALHTFVATVEGQANATKGDTMVLLDDSNSYWWLVRVVKDGSIGWSKPRPRHSLTILISDRVLTCRTH